MFCGASLTGGQVLGAFDGRETGWVTMALVGVAGSVYLHSHQTGVDASYRDRGIGREC